MRVACVTDFKSRRGAASRDRLSQSHVSITRIFRRASFGCHLQGVTSGEISYCLNVSIFMEDRCSLFLRRLLNYGRMRVCGKLTRSMPRDN